MADAAEIVGRIAAAADWNERVAEVRKIPAEFGTNEQPGIYASIAEQIYVPNLAPDFAYVPWTGDYELEPFQAAYEKAHQGTTGFANVSVDELARVIEAAPETLRIFRVLLGFTPQELAASTALVAEEEGLDPVSVGRIKGMEAGRSTTPALAKIVALTIDRAMSGAIFDEPPTSLRRKQDKPDTADGWESVRRFADEGVPFSTYLHQRHYGGAFRQLLDATSELRGNVLEDAVEELFSSNGVLYIRTGSHNQAEIGDRFGVTVSPAPDFVVFDAGDALRGLLECKGANDGGTARDKASRFRSLREEAQRLGGVPTFAVLGGLGWTRVNDTLGPVVRDTDGRVFTLANLDEMLTCLPFPQLHDIEGGAP